MFPQYYGAMWVVIVTIFSSSWTNLRKHQSFYRSLFIHFFFKFSFDRDKRAETKEKWKRLSRKQESEGGVEVLLVENRTDDDYGGWRNRKRSSGLMVRPTNRKTKWNSFHDGYRRRRRRLMELEERRELGRESLPLPRSTFQRLDKV